MSERIEIVSESDVDDIKARQVQRDVKSAGLPAEIKRPTVVIPRTPRLLSHSWPPTEEELKALYTLERRRLIGSVQSVDVQDGRRLVLMVEWIGTSQPPEILRYRKPVRKDPKYARLG